MTGQALGAPLVASASGLACRMLGPCRGGTVAPRRRGDVLGWAGGGPTSGPLWVIVSVWRTALCTWRHGPAIAPVAVPERGQPRRHTGARRVLIVDDDALCTLLVAALSDEGYAVTTAADGVQALQRLGDAAPFDLVLLDAKLPRLPGDGVLRALRALPDGQQVPVIVLTAATIGPTAAAWQAAQAIVAKPFDLEALLDLVAQWTEDTPEDTSTDGADGEPRQPDGAGHPLAGALLVAR